MDDDVRQAIEDLRGELGELARARSSGDGVNRAQRDVREARADLEDVLRENGYRISRRDLDEILSRRDEEKTRAQFEAWYLEKHPPEDDGEGDEDDEDGEGADGKPKKKPAAKKPAAKPGVKKGEEEEWV